jgi:hypothetical protein
MCVHVMCDYNCQIELATARQNLELVYVCACMRACVCTCVYNC